MHRELVRAAVEVERPQGPGVVGDGGIRAVLSRDHAVRFGEVRGEAGAVKSKNSTDVRTSIFNVEFLPNLREPAP